MADGASNLRSSPYLMLWPAGAICLTMLAFNVTGEWLSRGKGGRDGEQIDLTEALSMRIPAWAEG